jgi:HEPN domain-containing protein
MTKTEELRQWFEIADSDLQLAEDTSTKTYPVHEAQVCYHCQQSAEKYLKGYLRFCDIKFEKIHDLRKLQEQCGENGTDFKSLTASCSELNKYSSIPRYPVEWTITPSNMQHALQCAKIVQDFVKKTLTEAGYTPETGGIEVVATIEAKH